MYISILGSWSRRKTDGWSLKDRDGFVTACREFGKAIIDGDHMLLVDEEASKNTATWYAYKGILDAIESGRPNRACIGLIDPNNANSRYGSLMKKYPNTVIKMQSHLDGRARRRIFQLIRSDAVVFIGGAKSTHQLGRTARAGRQQQHIINVGSFGGAGRTLLDEQLADLKPADAAPYLIQNQPWNEDVRNHIFEQLGFTDTRTFLIIHGRGEENYKLKDVLQNRLGLPEPIIMKDDRTLTSHTLPEKFESLANNVRAAIAVITPDDVGGLVEDGRIDRVNYRARQNVWLEVGWFWGRLGRGRFLLLFKGEAEIPSDLQGIEVVRYQDNPIECLETIREFVERVTQPARSRAPIRSTAGSSASIGNPQVIGKADRRRSASA